MCCAVFCYACCRFSGRHFFHANAETDDAKIGQILVEGVMWKEYSREGDLYPYLPPSRKAIMLDV
jgi:hypothetical protein